MNSIMEIRNLNYLDFNNFYLYIKENSFTSIVGSIKTGKTTLVKIMSSIIETNNVCICNGEFLNTNNTFNYLRNIGVVFGVTNNSFIYKTVLDELKYSLINLGYSKNDINKKIIDILNEFNLSSIYNKSIDDLDISIKQVLLFIIALLHEPRVLLVDDAFLLMNENDKKMLFNYLVKLKNDNKLTIIYFSSKLDDVIKSDYLYLLENFCIKKGGIPLEILGDDQLFYQSGLEIPFMIDLSIKLKMYGLIDNIYLNMEELVDKIWK